MTVTEGDAAPAFEMAATGDRLVSLIGQRGRLFVLYFYPKADTPGCTREACAFQEALPALEKFAAKYGLTFPRASGTAEAFGSWVEKSMCGRRYTTTPREPEDSSCQMLRAGLHPRA